MAPHNVPAAAARGWRDLSLVALVVRGVVVGERHNVGREFMSSAAGIGRSLCGGEKV